MSGPNTPAARRAVAEARGLAEAELEVEWLVGARVPGLAVFRCERRPRPGQRGAYNAGVIAGETVELDPRRAIERVVRAWQYDERRPVAAAQVAEVIGFLVGGSTAATTALVDPARLAELPAAWHAHVAAPREVVVDGAPAVVFWVAGAFVEDSAPPFWRVELAVPADGAPVLRIESLTAVLAR
ncbi:MAG TPA: hypothetical protein VFP84_28210 [Kofleriaceae bacterium]|nr:hypothetical protein [Kofleriaceae bacterium]